MINQAKATQYYHFIRFINGSLKSDRQQKQRGTCNIRIHTILKEDTTSTTSL